MNVGGRDGCSSHKEQVVVQTVVLLAALCCASCAPPLLKLPTGSGLPASDGTDVVRDAIKACQAVSTITAEIAASGSVGGQRLSVRLLAGLAAPASVRLEAIAPFGQPAFIFVARDNDATLLLPRDRRVLEHGPPAAVLEAVAGVPLDAADLRIALTGCATVPRANDARQVGEDWRIVPDGRGEVYLHRESRTAPWHIVAAVHQGPGATPWRAEYRAFQRGGAADGLPAIVRLTSLNNQQFDLRLTLSQVELNRPLEPDVFRIQSPPGTDPIALDELKRSGPLSNRSSGK